MHVSPFLSRLGANPYGQRRGGSPSVSTSRVEDSIVPNIGELAHAVERFLCSCLVNLTPLFFIPTIEREA